MKLILHVDNLRNNRTLTNMRGENPRKSRIATVAPQSERIYTYTECINTIGGNEKKNTSYSA